MLVPVALSLLGGFRAERGGEPIVAFESKPLLLTRQQTIQVNPPGAFTLDVTQLPHARRMS